MHLKTLLSVAAGMVAGAALTLAIVATPASPAAAQMDAFAVAQKAQAMTTVYQLDQVGFHALSEEIAGGSVPAGALGKVRNARIMTAATSWPEPLHEQAQALSAKMVEYEAVLRTEDAAKAAPIAEAVHDLEHDFSGAVYTWLTGAPAPAPEHGH